MPVSGKESILNGIFRVWCVPQKSQSPVVKHRQVSGHNAVQFLGTVAKDAAANCWLSFNERCYRRHNRILSEQPRVSKTTDYLQQGWTLCLTANLSRSSAGSSFPQSFSLSIHSRTYAGQFSSFIPSASQPLETSLRRGPPASGLANPE